MEQQVTALYKPLYFYIKKRINNKEDAEDLTQDVFLKLSKSDLEKVKNVKSWVYTVAKNSITDYYRKRKTITENVEDVEIPEEESETDLATELTECVTPFIEKLPAEYRKILTLSEIKGIPQKEIAEQLDLNYATVRSNVQRGRKKLKGVFSDCCLILQGGKGSILSYEQKKTTNPQCDDC